MEEVETAPGLSLRAGGLWVSGVWWGRGGWHSPQPGSYSSTPAAHKKSSVSEETAPSTRVGGAGGNWERWGSTAAARLGLETHRWDFYVAAVGQKHCRPLHSGNMM